MEGSARLRVIADSGAVYALMDRSDAWHERVLRWWERAPDEVLLPVTTLPEITWLLARRIGAHAEAAFVRAVADRHYTVEWLEDSDLVRTAELVEAYADLELGFVDASLVAMAERLDVGVVLTTDRRHFGVVRPRHADRLRLVP